MTLSAAGISSRLETVMGPVMGVEDTASLQTFTGPMGDSLFDIYKALIMLIPVGVPAGNPTLGGSASITGPSESTVKSIIGGYMAAEVAPEDPAAFNEFLDGIAPGVVASYTPPNLVVTCPPSGGVATQAADASAIKSDINTAMKAEKDIQDETQLDKFSAPFSLAVKAVLELDMVVTFPFVGGQGVVT